MSAQGVVNQLRELAKVPSNREFIVKDQGCLPGLVLFLENEDIEVVHTALETISLLSKAKPNQNHMKNELGLLVSLEKLNTRDTAPRMRTLADEIIFTLTEEEAPAPTAAAMATSSKYSLKGASFFSKGAAPAKSRNMTFEIDGLDSVETRKQTEDALLSVMGTISFTFDMMNGRVTVRARKDVEPETYCRAINNKYNNLIPKQVVKNQYGEENVVDLIGIANGVSESAPDYFDDEEEEELKVENPKTALIPTGSTTGGNGWLGSTFGYIKKSLYW